MRLERGRGSSRRACCASPRPASHHVRTREGGRHSRPSRRSRRRSRRQALGRQAGEHHRLEEKKKRESRKTAGWRFSTSHATNCPPRAPLTPRNDGSLKEQADHTAQHGVPAGWGAPPLVPVSCPNSSDGTAVRSHPHHRLQTAVPLADKRTAPRNDRVARDGTIACRRLQVLRGGGQHDQRTRLHCVALPVDFAGTRADSTAVRSHPQHRKRPQRVAAV